MNPKPNLRPRAILFGVLLAAGAFGAGFEHGRHSSPSDQAFFPHRPAGYAPRLHAAHLSTDL